MLTITLSEYTSTYVLYLSRGYCQPSLIFMTKTCQELKSNIFAEVKEIEGIDNEIALVRATLKSMLINDPENARLTTLTNNLAKLVEIRIGGPRSK